MRPGGARLLRGDGGRQLRHRPTRLIFNRQIRKNTKSEFATKVVTRGTEVTVNAFYKHSRIKQYLKEGQALRVETEINRPTDFDVPRRLHNLTELVDMAKAANRQLLALERAGEACAIETALWERISQPSLPEGQRTGAIRFGDTRAMALAGALCVALNTLVGFTDEGLRFAVAYIKVGRQLLRPLLSGNQPPVPVELQRAFSTIEHHVDDYLTQARLRMAA